VTNKKIMIVEDSPAIADVVRDGLEKEGFHVHTVTNGFEALRDLEEVMPDLIISDINMPKLDGLKTCWAIQNRLETKDIPFILLSSQVDGDTLKRGKEIGACYFIAKPFEMDAVIKKVREALE